jgi:hypothetical protein
MAARPEAGRARDPRVDRNRTGYTRDAVLGAYARIEEVLLAGQGEVR